MRVCGVGRQEAGAGAAQAGQMQARFRACAGMAASVAAGMCTARHQHGGCGSPVLRAISMAQRLGWPHSGQLRGSGGLEATGMGHGTGLLYELKQFGGGKYIKNRYPAQSQYVCAAIK